MGGWAAIHHRVPADPETHAVIHGLRLLDPLKIERHYALVPPGCSVAARAEVDRLLRCPGERPRYMVIHPYPRNRYKCWTVDGWKAVIQHACKMGLRPVVTGGSATGEQRHLREILEGDSGTRVVDLSAKLNLPQVSDLLAHASLFLGPDTGVTHLAAAHGMPCVALYGPTDPVYWGPWPCGYRGDTPPFRRKGSQSCRNITLLQSDVECVACGREGCDDDPDKPSECMQHLEVGTVLAAMERMVGAV